MNISTFNARIPIYQQVIDHVEQLIVSGKLAPGQELPSRRELARHLGINPNTVQRAFSEMEAKHWLYTEAGRPSRLTTDPEMIQLIRTNWLTSAINDFIDALEVIGLTTDEMSELIEKEIELRKGHAHD